MCRCSIGTRVHVGACVIALVLMLPVSVVAQNAPAASPAASGQTFKQEELDAILAPIALYPDSLLSQVLMASTYPLEVVEAARWAEQNKGLKGDALANALQSQKWDENVKSLCAFPEVLDKMNKDLAWTQKVGDAFLGHQKEVMDTVQSLRQLRGVGERLKQRVGCWKCLLRRGRLRFRHAGLRLGCAGRCAQLRCAWKIARRLRGGRVSGAIRQFRNHDVRRESGRRGLSKRSRHEYERAC